MKSSGEMTISSEEACTIHSICSSTNPKITRAVAGMYCEYSYNVVNGLVQSVSAYAIHNMPAIVGGDEGEIVKKLLLLGSQFPDEVEKCISGRHEKEEHANIFKEMLLQMNIFRPDDSEKMRKIAEDPDSFFTEKDREDLRNLDKAFRQPADLWFMYFGPEH